MGADTGKLTGGLTGAPLGTIIGALTGRLGATFSAGPDSWEACIVLAAVPDVCAAEVVIDADCRVYHVPVEAGDDAGVAVVDEGEAISPSLSSPSLSGSTCACIAPNSAPPEGEMYGCIIPTGAPLGNEADAETPMLGDIALGAPPAGVFATC